MVKISSKHLNGKMTPTYGLRTKETPKMASFVTIRSRVAESTNFCDFDSDLRISVPTPTPI